MHKTFSHKYNIGQKVWHITPESLQGIILDISYSVLYNTTSYLVALGFDNEVWCLEQELNETKVII